MKCPICGTVKLRSPAGQKIQLRQKYCSRKCYIIGRERKRIRKIPHPLKCSVCGEIVLYGNMSTYNLAKRRGTAYHNKCWRERLGRISSATMRATNLRRSALLSERMRTNNPTRNPETLRKMSESLRGRTFLSRGGNGQFTRPQIILSRHAWLPKEYAIPTAPVAGRFQSLPTNYKVDLACPSVKLAIEVDGNSHRTKRWKFLDARKTEILTALGWKVLRFTNEEVASDLPGCLSKIRSTISRLQGMQTTS